MFRRVQGDTQKVRTDSPPLLRGPVRILLLLAVAAYGAALVQNINEVLHGIAHPQTPIPVVQHPVR
jgi:hypothetical protein